MNHDRCECHDCTQARARENIGGLGNIYPAMSRCPLCGCYGSHFCGGNVQKSSAQGGLK